MSKSNTKRVGETPQKTFLCVVSCGNVLLQWVSGRAFFLSFILVEKLHVTFGSFKNNNNNNNNKEIFRRSYLSRNKKEKISQVKFKKKNRFCLAWFFTHTHTHPERETCQALPTQLSVKKLFLFSFVSFFKWKRENLSSRACNVNVSLSFKRKKKVWTNGLCGWMFKSGGRERD